MMLLPVLENRLREGNNFHSCEQQPKKTLIHFFRKKTFDGNRCADLQIFFHDNKWKHFAKHAINKNKYKKIFLQLNYKITTNDSIFDQHVFSKRQILRSAANSF